MREMIGAYRIQEKLGEGGMGEVYRARDTRLKRDVAIKFLPESFASDPDRLARFQREAEALASLNHPNIATIHGVEQSGSDTGIVMELVEGSTLAELIAGRGMPLEEAAPIARQIADALEAAHGQGVIHRDLKPANIKIRPDGTVKVLDFGLAKIAETAGGGTIAGSALTYSPTVMSPGVTGAGMLLGTAAYMSPEQVRGRPVDKRADVWAFGCVLYEMLAGRPAFGGDDVTEVLAAVLKSEPDWSAVPRAARPLLQRCLQKDARTRLRDIGDAMPLLEAAAEAAPEPQVRTSRIPWLLAAVLGIAALLLASALALSDRQGTSPPRPMRLSIALPDGWQLALDRVSVTTSSVPLAVSPDGRRVALVARRGSTPGTSILVHDLESGSAQPLEGTGGANSVFWSPDGRALGFISNRITLKKVALDGTPPQVLAQADAVIAGGTWNRDGTIVVAQVVFGTPGLKQVSADGGALRDAVPPDPEETRTMPWFLPDGRHLLYTAFAGPALDQVERRMAVYVGALDSAERVKLLDADARNVQYVDGHLLYLRGDTLMAHPFDAERRALNGEARPVARGILRSGGRPADGWFSAADSGVLMYLTGPAAEQANDSQLAWLDRGGKVLERLGDPAFFSDVALAPNGRRAVAVISNELQLVDLARGVPTRLVSRLVRNPIWAANGTRVAFASTVGAGTGVYVVDADGGGEQLVFPADGAVAALPASWSNDGRFLLLVRGTGPFSNNDIWVLPLDGERRPFPLLNTAANETRPRFSPDGRWIAYTSDESKTPALYVARFIPPASGQPAASALTRVQRVSKGAGTSPRWRADGREIVYLHPTTGTLMAASVDGSGEEFLVHSEEELFTLPRADPSVASLYDLSRDGTRVLATIPVETSSAAAAQFPTVVLNWTAGLGAP